MAFQTVCLAAYSSQYVNLIPINVRGQDTAEARNSMTKTALDNGADYLLWVDADMIFPPDALVRLLNRNVDIAGTEYRRRAPPYAPVGIAMEGGKKTEDGLTEYAVLPVPPVNVLSA